MTATLVIGAHGTVGSELSRLLAAQGQTVRRATSRPPTAADEVRLNLLTGEGLAAALAGADQAFLLAPPGHVNQHELLNPVIDQARASGVQKVVLMSAMGANADPAAPLRQAELRLEASGLAWNVVRPNWFMPNFHTFWLHGITSQGQIQLPVGQAKGSFIGARDIDLTGAEALDHDAVAAILSRETGRAIGYQDIAPEAMRAGLFGAGLPAPFAEFMLLIRGFFKAGYAERTTGAVATLTGRAPRSFAGYAHDHRAAWLV